MSLSVTVDRFSTLVLDRRWDGGLLALLATKGADLLTTIVGLTVVDGLSERNPVGSWAYTEAGALGLVSLSLIGVGVLVFTVEATAHWLGSLDDTVLSRRHLVWGSYVPVSLLYGYATVHNTILILAHGT